MSDELLLLQEASIRLSDYFEQDTLRLVQTKEKVIKQLAEAIVFLLLHDMEKLMNILYRIDVFERDTKAAFAQNNPEQIAPRLAELILNREMQKAKTRLAYRNHKN
ncbi:MAG: hypothetical protein EAY81_03970 [Bacteroidetes bacterium]|nr:MAG: hypothetical protein EAY81_03970 [Bacteroidota bacterium]